MLLGISIQILGLISFQSFFEFFSRLNHAFNKLPESEAKTDEKLAHDYPARRDVIASSGIIATAQFVISSAYSLADFVVFVP
jgi:hypothetical protein